MCDVCCIPIVVPHVWGVREEAKCCIEGGRENWLYCCRSEGGGASRGCLMTHVVAVY